MKQGLAGALKPRFLLKGPDKRNLGQELQGLADQWGAWEKFFIPERDLGHLERVGEKGVRSGSTFTMIQAGRSPFQEKEVKSKCSAQ
jgi:hypothetical protein